MLPSDKNGRESNDEGNSKCKIILGYQISHDGHQSARNRGRSTEDFTKMD